MQLVKLSHQLLPLGSSKVQCHEVCESSDDMAVGISGDGCRLDKSLNVVDDVVVVVVDDDRVSIVVDGVAFRCRDRWLYPCRMTLSSRSDLLNINTLNI